MKKITALVLVLILLTTQSFAYGVKVPVILYHNIAEEYNPDEALLHITPQRFREHMEALVENGFTPISMKEYYDYVNGQGQIPYNSILVTFDDGYISNYEYAYPIMKEMGLKGTIFIVTSTVGQSPGAYPHFTWAQAKEMSDSGVMEIGSHTHTHGALSMLDLAVVRKEIRYSKYLIEKNLGKPCDYIAFPYGFWHEDVFITAHYAGYKLQCMVGEQGYNEKTDEVARPLKRLTISGLLTGDQLVELINQNLSGNVGNNN